MQKRVSASGVFAVAMLGATAHLQAIGAGAISETVLTATATTTGAITEPGALLLFGALLLAIAHAIRARGVATRD